MQICRALGLLLGFSFCPVVLLNYDDAGAEQNILNDFHIRTTKQCCYEVEWHSSEFIGLIDDMNPFNLQDLYFDLHAGLTCYRSFLTTYFLVGLIGGKDSNYTVFILIMGYF